jgi:hypothetical protein
MFGAGQLTWKRRKLICAGLVQKFLARRQLRQPGTTPFSTCGATDSSERPLDHHLVRICGWLRGAMQRHTLGLSHVRIRQVEFATQPRGDAPLNITHLFFRTLHTNCQSTIDNTHLNPAAHSSIDPRPCVVNCHGKTNNSSRQPFFQIRAEQFRHQSKGIGEFVRVPQS